MEVEVETWRVNRGYNSLTHNPICTTLMYSLWTTPQITFLT